jgi:hypothetical protein
MTMKRIVVLPLGLWISGRVMIAVFTFTSNESPAFSTRLARRPSTSATNEGSGNRHGVSIDTKKPPERAGPGGDLHDPARPLSDTCGTSFRPLAVFARGIPERP